MKAGERRRLSSNILPEEILEQIFARIASFKSLLRCTAVCKSWCAIIKSTSFINFYPSLLQGTDDGNHNYLLCEFDETEEPYYAFIYEEKIEAFQDHRYFKRHGHDHDTNKALQAPYFAIHTDTEAFHEYCRLLFPLDLLQVHACHGLICFNTSDDPNTLYLWNPVIRKLKQVPTPLKKVPTPPPNLNNYEQQYSFFKLWFDGKRTNEQHSVFKLWFDGKTNDHRILRITYTTKSCTVEVYSLSTNSWKIITDDAPVTTSFLNSNRLAYVNGTFYWPALRDGNWTLISLQVDNWMFQERLTTWTACKLYLSPSVDNDYLVVLENGRVLDFFFDFVDPDIQVYDQSLNRFYTMEITGAYGIVERYQPLGIRNNGELLLQNTDPDKLSMISYNVETKQYKEFVPTTSHRLIRTIPFVRTLALLNDAASCSTQ